MKVSIIVNANPATGYGHYHRCRSLADALVAGGHEVSFVGDAGPRIPAVRHFYAHTDVIAEEWIRKIIPHWVVVDTHGVTPSWVYSDLWRTAVIDGVGQPDTEQADLIISQGMDGQYAAPDYLMLRPELSFVHRKSHYSRKWLVFGGGFDEMGLCERFARTMLDQTAYIMAPYEITRNPKHWVESTKSTQNIISIYGIPEQACLSMGMTVWEMLYLKIPCYVLSKTDRHLESAQKMEPWIRYHPQVGMPEDLREFLSQAPKMEFPNLDLKGAYRVVELLCQS